MDIIFIIILASLWGSFANVCIYRLPQNKGVILGRSYCPKCKQKINWYDNIPILSFIIIRGRCSNCKKPISLQYPLIELLSIIVLITIYLLFGVTATTLLLMILALNFIIIFFIDLKHYIIPDILTFPMMALGFIKSFMPNLNPLFPNFINSFLGGIIGYGIIWLIIFAYKKLRNQEGMGLGDAKLLAVIGFWFGWIAIPFVIFISSIVALVLVSPSLFNKSKKLSSEIPFGPYIIIGCVLYVIFIDAYKNLLFG